MVCASSLEKLGIPMVYAAAGTVSRERSSARRYVRICKLSEGQSGPVRNGVEQFVRGAPSMTSTTWYATDAASVARDASFKR